MASLGCSKPRGGATDLQGSAGAEPRPTLLWPPSSQSPRGLPGWAGNRAHWAGLQPISSPQLFAKSRELSGGRGGIHVPGFQRRTTYLPAWRVLHLREGHASARGRASAEGSHVSTRDLTHSGIVHHGWGDQPSTGISASARKMVPLAGGFLRSGDHVLRGRESHDRWRIELPASVRRPLTSGRACSAGRLV